MKLLPWFRGRQSPAETPVSQPRDRKSVAAAQQRLREELALPPEPVDELRIDPGKLEMPVAPPHQPLPGVVIGKRKRIYLGLTPKRDSNAGDPDLS
jgi:hypothetical protein